MYKLGFAAFSLLAICVSAETNTEKIVGGYVASDGQFPYQASLRTIQGQHFCGAVIINSYWLITAAHCVRGRAPQSIMVVVGTNSLRPSGTAYGISQVKIHERYNPSKTENNIALLRLNGFIQFGPKVQAIALSNRPVPQGALCTLSGWGYLHQGSNSVSEKLQYVTLSAISLQQCRNALAGTMIYNSEICTLQGYGKGGCNGDSGGPLVFNGQLQGVLSWGTPCAVGKPDVYSSIPAYRQWISFNTGI